MSGAIRIRVLAYRSEVDPKLLAPVQKLLPDRQEREALAEDKRKVVDVVLSTEIILEVEEDRQKVRISKIP